MNNFVTGKPIMDMILQPGDLLYMPRGTIHQGNCLEDTHSLHITVSCHQLNTYGDLLEKLLPMALKVFVYSLYLYFVYLLLTTRSGPENLKKGTGPKNSSNDMKSISWIFFFFGIFSIF